MKKIVYLLLLHFACWQGLAHSDDIDIYIDSKTSSVPLLMLMLDWRPSVFSTHCNQWNDACKATMSESAAEALENARIAAGTPFTDKVSRYEVFVAVLESVMSDEAYDPIHMGLMISNFDEGGAILEGYKELGDLISDHFPADEIATFPAALQAADAQIKDHLAYRLRQITEPANQSASHKLQPSEAFYEMYSYWNGGKVFYSSSLGTANNFQSITPPNPAFDTKIQNVGGTQYIAPSEFSSSSCTKLYAILLAMNVANDDDDLDNEIKAAMPAENAEKKFENLLDYTVDHDLVSAADGTQELITWVISDSQSKGQTATWAVAGGSGDGLLDFEDAVALEEKLKEIFTEIISVSSTFVAASVPVNVFNRVEALDNLFIALFEAQANIRWPGNLKKLRLKDSDSDGVFDDIVDANDLSALEKAGSDIGRIKTGALTFWTVAGSLPEADPEQGEVDGKDGRSVERGGAGQIVPGFISGVIGDGNGDSGARQLYVEPSSGTSLDAFNSDATTASALQSLLGASSQAEAQTWIKWARGQDTDDIDSDSNTTEARSWILPDAIHSRPLPVNYGTAESYSEGNPNIVLFMGTNDGFFHAFQNTTAGGAESGKELWGFIPRELLDNIELLKTNTESSSKMRYGADGAPAALVVDTDQDGTIETADGDEVIVYFGLRRGGYSYYALDVSAPFSAPTLKWKITQTSGGDFDQLGLTFSKPVVAKVKYGSSATDVVIFAGGYNGGWDNTYTNRVGKDLNDADDSVGNAIYIVNARTGDLIWKAVLGASTGPVSNTEYQHSELVDSIPAEIAVVDGNRNGIADRLYVGDTGGAVWRVDLTEGTDADQRRDHWFITKFAELGTDGATTDRRFFHRPDVVQTRDSNGNYDGVLIESGDRAHPLETEVANYLFLLKDRLTRSGDTAVLSRAALTVADGDLPDVTTCLTGNEASCVTAPLNGWKILQESSGEKGLSSPIVDGGMAIFTTYIPSSTESACDVSEGDGAVYFTSLADGTPAFGDKRKYDLGPGIPPGAVATGGVLIIPGGGAEISDLDGDTFSDRQVVVKSTSKNLWIIYWREPKIDEL